MAPVLGALGLFLCFWGGRLVKPAMAITALVAGAALGAWVGGQFASQRAAWVLAAVGALAALAIVMLAYKAGLLILGALTGAILYNGAVALSGFGSRLPPWGIIIAAFAGGMLCWWLRERVMAALTAVAGAYITVEAATRLWSGRLLEWGDPPPWAHVEVRHYAWFLLALVGIVIQRTKSENNNKKDE